MDEKNTQNISKGWSVINDQELKLLNQLRTLVSGWIDTGDFVQYSAEKIITELQKVSPK